MYNKVAAKSKLTRHVYLKDHCYKFILYTIVLGNTQHQSVRPPFRITSAKCHGTIGWELGGVFNYIAQKFLYNYITICINQQTTSMQGLPLTFKGFIHSQ